MAKILLVTVMTCLVIILFFAFVGLALFYLHWRNSHVEPEQIQKIDRSRAVKITLFILKDVVLEAIGFAFFIVAIISFQNKAKWRSLNMHAIEISFYFFQGLKYAMLVFSVVSEHYEELDDKITHKLARFGVRADWKELLEGLIFIPSVIIDGMIVNAEFYVGDDGDAFNGDGIVMLVIDLILWIKLCTTLLLHQYSAKGNPPYQVKEFAYALVIFFYSVLLVFFFIVEHQRVISISKMNLTPTLEIILVNALTHAYVCSYTSMMAQGIIMFDKALRGSQARITQLQLFIRYLSIRPIPILLTLGLFAYTMWVYISVWIYTMVGHRNLANQQTTEGLIRAVYIMVQIFTTFMCANVLYALLKRFGGYFNIQIQVFGLKFPDCSSYAEKINTILGQCTANFRLDHRGQVARR
eukprot:Phypoly_transcript_09589.p1 GENE.Phypoly_transcript_09589~~Phypoly_transcript_09589.p1  ORF type:complete len:411 (+),score=36.61 Phypoly_transcript_09589:145-1377(+)